MVDKTDSNQALERSRSGAGEQNRSRDLGAVGERTGLSSRLCAGVISDNYFQVAKVQLKRWQDRLDWGERNLHLLWSIKLVPKNRTSPAEIIMASRSYPLKKQAEYKTAALPSCHATTELCK
jgi:hypothetical protein